MALVLFGAFKYLSENPEENHKKASINNKVSDH